MNRIEDFYNHPAIKPIREIPKWAVVDNNKHPIDIGFLMDPIIRIQNIKTAGVPSTNTLKTVIDTLKHPTNFTYNLDGKYDHIVVLDIEPKCPEDIKKELLKANAIYRETSMSGKGYHLIFPMPHDILKQYPNAINKIVLKEKHGYYEILINHWITFTGNQIKEPDEIDDTIFPKIVHELAKQQKETKKTVCVNETLNEENLQIVQQTKHYDEIFHTIVAACNRYSKTINDYNEDHSSYEYGYMCSIYNNINNVTKCAHILKDYEYTMSEKILISYAVGKETLPYRQKHDQYRDGLPWLLYLARETAEAKESEWADKKKKTKRKGKKKHE